MTTTTTDDPLMARAKALYSFGLLAHWQEIVDIPSIEPLIRWGEQERALHSLGRHLGNAYLSPFPPLAHLDREYLKSCDREAIEGLLTLGFVWTAAIARLGGRECQPLAR